MNRAARWALVVWGGVAAAGWGQENWRPSAEKTLERFDANGDGFIDREEAPERMKRRFSLLDTSYDGRVDRNELLAEERAWSEAADRAARMTNRVEVSIEGDRRVLRANGIPNHATGRFPGPGNPNAIAEMSFEWKVPLQPQRADKPQPTGIHWFGVAVNGVPLEPGTQEHYREDRSSPWILEAIGGESNLGIDQSLAHVQAQRGVPLPWPADRPDCETGR